MTTVYTAIFGNFDHLRSPRDWDIADTYACICNPWMSVPAPWEILVRDKVGSNRLSARYYKIMSHKAFPNAKVTVWHGGNVQLLTKARPLLDIMGDADIAVLRHSDRDNVYDEANMCIRWHKDSAPVINKQVSRYRSEGFNGKPLSAAFLMVRRHTDQIAALNEMWWEEVKNGSVRDQLSFDYCCWKLGIEPVILPGSIHSGPHFVRHALHGHSG